MSCHICTATSPDGIHLCANHIDAIRAWLNQTPDLLDDLDVTIARLDQLSSNNFGLPPGHSGGLPWNDHASRVRSTLVTTLRMWSLAVARLAEDDRDRLNEAGPRPSQIAEWLNRNRHTLARHPDAGDAYRDLRDPFTAAQRAIDRSDMCVRFHVGPCPERAPDGGYCPGEVWAFVPTAEDEPALLRCRHPDCAAAWDTTRWLRAARRILARKRQLDAGQTECRRLAGAA